MRASKKLWAKKRTHENSYDITDIDTAQQPIVNSK